MVQGTIAYSSLDPALHASVKERLIENFLKSIL